MQFTVKEARAHFGDMLTLAQKGEPVAITRRGKKIVQVSASETPRGTLPSLAAFRESIHVTGTLGQAVTQDRSQERY